MKQRDDNSYLPAFAGGGVFWLISARALLCAIVGFAVLSASASEKINSLKPKFTSEMTVIGCTNEVPLVNFPVAVRISTTKISGFDYEKCDGEDDISFSDESGNVLPHEVEVWNTEGESVAWVSLPSMKTNTVFYMNWCHKTKLATTHSEDVWTNSTANYKGVWHMNEFDSTLLTQSDSTGNGFAATYTVSSKCGVTATSIGKSFYRTMDKNTVGQCATTPNLKSVMKMDWTGVTLSGWAYYKGYAATGQQHLLWVNNSETGSYYWGLTTQNKTVRSKFGTASGAVIGAGLNPASGWFHWAVRVTGKTTFDYFLNGELLETLTGKNSKYSTGSSTTEWTCGGTTGYIDEFRYRNAASSDDWIKAEYDSINNKAFIVASAAVKNGGGFFIIIQ